MHTSSSGLDVLKSCTRSSPQHALSRPKIVIGVVLYSTPTLSYLNYLLTFRLLFLFCCVALDLSTIFTLAPLPLVLAEAAATAVFAPTPLPLVIVETAASAVFAPAPPPLMFTDATAVAVFAVAPPPLVLADAATATVFALAPHPLVLAEAAATAVFASTLLLLILTQDRGLAGFLGCRRMWCRNCVHSGSNFQVRTTLFVLAVLALWPSGPQNSLLACHSNLRAIRVIRHPTLQRILHVEAFCAIGAVLPLSRVAPVSTFCFTPPPIFGMLI